MVTEPLTDTDDARKNGAGSQNRIKVPKRWPRWMSAFLIELARRGIVGQACNAAGVSKETAYKYRRDPRWAEFRKMWDEAIETAYDAIEQIAIDRATDPNDPGFDPSPSAGLLKWLLEAYRPHKFKRDKGVHVGPVYVLKVGEFPERHIRSAADLDGLSDAELEAIAEGDLMLEEADYRVLNGDDPKEEQRADM